MKEIDAWGLACLAPVLQIKAASQGENPIGVMGVDLTFVLIFLGWADILYTIGYSGNGVPRQPPRPG